MKDLGIRHRACRSVGFCKEGTHWLNGRRENPPKLDEEEDDGGVGKHSHLHQYLAYLCLEHVYHWERESPPKLDEREDDGRDGKHLHLHQYLACLDSNMLIAMVNMQLRACKPTLSPPASPNSVSSCTHRSPTSSRPRLQWRPRFQRILRPEMRSSLFVS